MHGSIFALVVIAMICTTLAVLKTFGKRPDARAALAGALLMIVTFLVLWFVAFGHSCSRGGPFGAVAFGAVLAGVVRATVQKKVVRRWLWAGWFVLTFWGMNLCHLDGYIGNPRYGGALSRMRRQDLAYVQDVLRNAPENRKNLRLPEGWVEESWRAGTGEDFPEPTTCRSGTLEHCWHTWFTGIFSLETHDCGMWCSGGSLESCSESLEIRPRRDSNGDTTSN
jgi:hypothetical protein